MKPSTSLGTRSNVGMAKPSPVVRQAANIWGLLVIHGVYGRSVPSGGTQVKYRCRCRVINGEHFGLNELFFSNLTPQHLFHSDRAFHNMDMRLQRGRNCVYKRRHVLGYRDRILLKPMQLRATLLLDSRVVCSNMVREAAPTWSEKRTSVFRPLKKKGFKEERVTTIGLDDIGTSTTLESNKSLVNALIGFQGLT